MNIHGLATNKEVIAALTKTDGTSIIGTKPIFGNKILEYQCYIRNTENKYLYQWFSNVNGDVKTQYITLRYPIPRPALLCARNIVYRTFKQHEENRASD